MTNIVVRCDKCKNEFRVSSVDIQHSPVASYGQQLELVYFICPKCNQLYRVALRDRIYNELQKDLANTSKRLRKMQERYGDKNVEFVGALRDMVQIKAKRLKAHTDQLNGKFPGTFVLAVLENGEGKIVKYLP